ncbi:MAG: MAPEG family protein, partial [Thermostichales cyanobacterium SZTDM-1c_bins_54]
VPYVLVAYGRFAGGFDPEVFKAPRAAFDRLPDYAKRASWAHQNSFEVFPPFAAACLMSFITAPYPFQIFGIPAEVANGVISLLFVLARLSYAAAYILDRAAWRSLSWGVSVLCTATLMVTALRSVTTTL